MGLDASCGEADSWVGSIGHNDRPSRQRVRGRAIFHNERVPQTTSRMNVPREEMNDRKM